MKKKRKQPTNRTKREMGGPTVAPPSRICNQAGFLAGLFLGGGGWGGGGRVENPWALTYARRGKEKKKQEEEKPPVVWGVGVGLGLVVTEDDVRLS